MDVQLEMPDVDEGGSVPASRSLRLAKQAAKAASRTGHKHFKSSFQSSQSGADQNTSRQSKREATDGQLGGVRGDRI